MTINTLKNIKKTLNLKIPICQYQRPLDYPNITYTVVLITNSDFEDLNFLVLPKIGNTTNIKKTLIFVDSIKKNIILEKHL